ncbi:hypothetical protein P7K49_039665 [Saguinus oedipus]|uniref:Uncharacterized protein n=1 Tax=Saguinus oedipus TaxID=9490 RepID=A0ABQ9TBV2_SAGOE|nr:hypothetical protein P7K49_039665 [Saguinus oedipus]
MPDYESPSLISFHHQPHTAHVVPHTFQKYLLIHLPLQKASQQGEAGAVLRHPLRFLAQLHPPLLQGIPPIHNGACHHLHPVHICWMVQNHFLWPSACDQRQRRRPCGRRERSAEDWAFLDQEGMEMRNQVVKGFLLVEEEEKMGQEWEVPAVEEFAKEAHIGELQ